MQSLADILNSRGTRKSLSLAGLASGFVAAFLCLGTIPLFAASIWLTQPNSQVQVETQSDFAEDALGHPWDMSRVRDIAFDANFNQPTSAGGVWSATSVGANAYFFPLSTGFIDPFYSPSAPQYAFFPTHYDNGTPYGQLNPIDANKYKRFSVKMSMNKSHRDFVYIGWSRDPNVSPSDLGNAQTGHLGIGDKDLTTTGPGSWIYVNMDSGYRIYDIGLDGDFEDAQRTDWHTIPYSHSGATWGGTVYGLQVIPSSSFPAGATVSVDWMRLYDPNTSPTVDIRWGTSGTPSEFEGYTIRLYLDTDNSGYDGFLYKADLIDDGHYPLKTDALPPGDYYAYVRVIHHVNGQFNNVGTSGYSPRIRVGHRPLFNFTSPTFSTGEDYATTVLGNPWDMNSISDIDSHSGLSGLQFDNGILKATSIDPDSLLYLNTPIAIDSTKYRYLNLRMKTDPLSFNLNERATLGWQINFTWWNQGLSTDGTYSRDLNTLEDWRTYTIDLWDNRNANPHHMGSFPMLGWEEIGQVTKFRLDPVKNVYNTPFEIDDVKICADNYPVNEKFNIAWNITDPDSGSVSLKLYYGHFEGSTYVEESTPILDTDVSPGPGSFEWDVLGIPNGRHYIRAEVSDGGATQSWYSEAPVVLENSVPLLNTSGSDPAVFHVDSATWHIYGDSQTIYRANWGWPGAEPVTGDYDGDGRDDIAIFDQNTGNWFIRDIDGNIIVWAVSWGWPGVRPVPGDYDGDGTDDLAIFDQNTGRWFIRRVDGPIIGWSVYWGWPGTEPVPGDYDGDGTAELSIFDQNTGRWFIRRVDGPILGWSIYWGWPGVRPVPGDYDNDGVDDLAIYDQNSGRWFIQNMDLEIMTWNLNWGFAGTMPVSGDFDRDGFSDYAVFDPGTGYWYFLYNAGGVEIGGPWVGPGCVPVSGNFDGF